MTAPIPLTPPVGSRPRRGPARTTVAATGAVFLLLGVALLTGSTDRVEELGEVSGVPISAGAPARLIGWHPTAVPPAWRRGATPAPGTDPADASSVVGVATEPVEPGAPTAPGAAPNPETVPAYASLLDPPRRPSRPMDGAVAPAPVAPTALALPDRGVNAPVVAVVTAPDGALVVPPEPSTVGWWSPSAPAGSAVGTTVLAGHVDSVRSGLGALAVLRDVEIGEPVLLRGDGPGGAREVRYRVTARRQYAKAELPAEIFAKDGAPRLVLITCGGPFDRATRHYADNVVVFAEPEPEPEPASAPAGSPLPDAASSVPR